ncbi:MAG: hypothetical protein LJE84_14085 [Gammaproteobacteria bacterium]|nr:hypothetical protein [Gammaproteobacteria bacterium]
MLGGLVLGLALQLTGSIGGQQLVFREIPRQGTVELAFCRVSQELKAYRLVMPDGFVLSEGGPTTQDWDMAIRQGADLFSQLGADDAPAIEIRASECPLRPRISI